MSWNIQTPSKSYVLLAGILAVTRILLHVEFGDAKRSESVGREGFILFKRPTLLQGSENSMGNSTYFHSYDKKVPAVSSWGCCSFVWGAGGAALPHCVIGNIRVV